MSQFPKPTPPPKPAGWIGPQHTRGPFKQGNALHVVIALMILALVIGWGIWVAQQPPPAPIPISRTVWEDCVRAATRAGADPDEKDFNIRIAFCMANDKRMK